MAGRPEWDGCVAKMASASVATNLWNTRQLADWLRDGCSGKGAPLHNCTKTAQSMILCRLYSLAKDHTSGIHAETHQKTADKLSALEWETIAIEKCLPVLASSSMQKFFLLPQLQPPCETVETPCETARRQVALQWNFCPVESASGTGLPPVQRWLWFPPACETPRRDN